MVSYTKDPVRQNFCKQIGRRIKLARRAAGLTQERLADGLGIRFQQIQKYESGENRISAERLNQIARTLGKSITFFYDDLESVELPDKKVDRTVSSAAVRLFELPANLAHPISNLILSLTAH